MLILQSLAYQSYDITFSEWISILTVSLAPLVMHIASGVPQPSILAPTNPTWHDRICLYNPTSILWRYAAIADRRIRARGWNAVTMAATNAVFWTDRGWEGSEAMALRSAPCCTRRPEHPRVRVLSTQMLKTVVIMLQGAQGLYAGLEGITKGWGFAHMAMGVDGIFVFIAIFGLLRLCAASWLTDDFAFNAHEGIRGPLAVDTLEASSSPSSLCLPDGPRKTDNGHTAVFLPVSYWGSRLFRAGFCIIISGLWGFSLYVAMRMIWPEGPFVHTTITAFLVTLLFTQIATSNLMLVAYQIMCGRTTTTIIPCASRIWYKLFTLWLFGWVAVAFIIACLETRGTICGRYTSFPQSLGDQSTCFVGTELEVVSLNLTSRAAPRTYVLSVVETGSGTNSSSNPEMEAIFIQNFTGSCVGRFNSDLT